jgi:hypothetical protein
MRRWIPSLPFLLAVSLSHTLDAASPAGAQRSVAPPPNTPATVEWNQQEGRVRLRYHGVEILNAVVQAELADGKAVSAPGVRLETSESRSEDGKVEQVLSLRLAEPQPEVRVTLRGRVMGSEEAFSAETLSAAQERFPLVRNSVGPSRNRRNNAVYDRRWDWVLTGPGAGATRIEPATVDSERAAFSWLSRGPAVELTFRPRFYQKHKELEHFTPWTYAVWQGALTGYCTWWAYRNGFSQTDLDAVVDVFERKQLPDFGYDYIQLDDCYQIGNGNSPRGWLTWNERWPGGPDYTINRIRSAGMKPGIWVHRVHRSNGLDVKEIVAEHPEWFVSKPDGTLHLDHGFYCLNTHNPEALEGMARVTYRALKEQGWDYVKIDGTGDLLWAYQKAPEFFERIGSTPGETLRLWDVAAREELGPDVYILACWGVDPSRHVIGLVDGCRLGSDGFGTGEFQRFNSWNGVVWRNDPDHCDILGEYYMDNDAMMPVFGVPSPVPARSIIRPALCSLAGGVLMVSDKVAVYEDDRNLEGMKRSAPVLFTVPGQLYDFSPRRPGEYRVGLHGNEATWWMLEVDRPFDHWSVLGRFQWGERQGEEHRWEYDGEPEQTVAFADLGLAADRDYAVFEFWTQRFLGVHRTAFTAPALDEDTGMQVFAIRETRSHPWVLSTTRHLSQGGVSLLDEQWDAATRTLSGRSTVVGGDPYVLTVHLPDGNRLKSAEIAAGNVEIQNQEEIATVRIVPSATSVAEWKLTFDTEIRVTDFGVEPDSGRDAVKGVRAAIAACAGKLPATLVFPKGRYDFLAEHSEQIDYFESNTTDNNPKTCPIVLRGIKGLTIEGNGSEFVFHGRMQPLTLENCADITVRHLDLDWDIPLVAQARIAQVAEKHIDIRINPGESPFRIVDGKIVFHGEGWESGWWGCMEFDAETRIIPQQSGDSPLGGGWHEYEAEELEPGLVRLHHAFRRKPREGNILIMRHSARDHAGVFIYRSKDIRFEDVNLFTAAGLGFLGQFSENITLRRVNVMPNHAKGRYQSGHADGFQVSNCRGQILVENCRFEGLMDDPINVHGTSVKVIERRGPARLLCRFMHGMSTGMTWGGPGDRVGFIDHETMETLGERVIRSLSSIDRDHFEVEFANTVPSGFEPGDALENLTWAPDFTARNCWFGSCRARGLLVSTPGKVVIENNDFVSSGAAILIAGDANGWYESGAVKDVLIKGNRFHPSCLTSWYQFGEGVISILPIIPKFDPAKPFHRNIRITGNEFDMFDYSVLYALSVDGLQFRDNVIKHNNLYRPWQGRKAMLTFEACKRVEISGNRVAREALGRNVAALKMDAADITIAAGQEITGPGN